MSTPKIQLVISILPVFSGCLSLVSSSILLRKIYKKIKNATYRTPIKPRDYLLVFISIYDIIESFAMSLSTFPGPKYLEYNYYLTYGTITTCTIQGFLIQLGGGSIVFVNEKINLDVNANMFGNISKTIHLSRMSTLWIH